MILVKFMLGCFADISHISYVEYGIIFPYIEDILSWNELRELAVRQKKRLAAGQ